MVSPSPTTPQLRVDPEAELAHAPQAEAPARSADELLHELQVHQIELEMQNETLRQAQVALWEFRDRYMDIYEFAPVGYLTLTDTGLIAEINLAGAALLGDDRKKLLHHRFAHFVAPEGKDKWHRYFQHALQHGGKQACELGFQDGKVRASVNCHPTADSDATPVLRMTLTDITELNRAMAALLRTREDRLLLAKRAAGLGIYVRDIASGTIEWDERAREIWGVGPDEPISYQTFMAGVHPDDRAATQAVIDSAFKPRGSALGPSGSVEYNAEYRVVNRIDGIVRNISAYGQVYFENGRAVRSVGVMRDISRLKQLEIEAQERRNEMELLVKQQVAAQTAAAIAHELNQPLVSISAYSEAALRMLRGGVKNPEKLARALEGAMEQAQRAGRTLHELLDFLHKGDTVSEPVDLNDVVHEALAIAAESGYGGFRPVVELEHDLPPVLANRLQLQKILVNLLHNGVEAMRGAGVPTAAITITVRTVAGRNMAQVTVQDSGPGLDAETAHRIFEPFFTTKPNGIGLGLAISRALVEAHGGQLWAELETWPRRDVSLHLALRLMNGDATVFVVDDDPAVRDSLTLLLEQEDLRCRNLRQRGGLSGGLPVGAAQLRHRRYPHVRHGRHAAAGRTVEARRPAAGHLPHRPRRHSAERARNQGGRGRFPDQAGHRCGAAGERASGAARKRKAEFESGDESDGRGARRQPDRARTRGDGPGRRGAAQQGNRASLGHQPSDRGNSQGADHAQDRCRHSARPGPHRRRKRTSHLTGV